jgi:hypothetical protein
MKTKSIIVLVVALVTVSGLVAFKSVSKTPKVVTQQEVSSPNSGGFALKD